MQADSHPPIRVIKGGSQKYCRTIKGGSHPKVDVFERGREREPVGKLKTHCWDPPFLAGEDDLEFICRLVAADKRAISRGETHQRILTPVCTSKAGLDAPAAALLQFSHPQTGK